MRSLKVAISEAIALTLLLGGVVKAQMAQGYLDVMTCRVKPDKRADFDGICKKMAEANRKHKGDTYLTMQTEYGAQNTVMFVSTRENYAAIDKGGAAFMSAMKEAFGPTVMEQMLQDFNKCLASSRGELRRRRWDLSVNVPPDPAAVFKAIGEARWLRANAIHVRPGRVDDFEAQIKTLKEALEKANAPMILVSQSLVGQEGTVFYLSTPRTSLAAFDDARPPLRELLGDSPYQQFQKAISENVQSSETTLARFLPELSNAPKEVVDASPEFWTPKPAMGGKSRAKPKPAEPAKPAE